MSASTAVHLRNPTSIYFGKVVSRGDFVKSAAGTHVIALIDKWVAQGMEMLIASPAWKAYYDNAGAIDFLFIALRKKHAICGCLTPSEDASSRRFPFIAATLFETDDAAGFLPFSLLMLERHFGHQRALSHHAVKTYDAADTLLRLNDVPFETKSAQDNALKSYDAFLLNTSITGLSETLHLEEGQVALRRMVLAIGYLLQPILSNYLIPPQKGLALPLPHDQEQLAFVKTLWLDLVSVFLGRSEFELSVFSCTHYGKPKLIITFNGTTPNAFLALFEEQAAQEYLIDVSQSIWVEDYVHQDPATFKLASYMEHGNLTLRQMAETFRQSFFG
ncbi:MAG TPA: type VI secretion system-associated protein TagF [Noviherbaspirillum sp.]|nr:type VI secretion system-associated protein TagF [Noviherbaspirillum sp.]